MVQPGNATLQITLGKQVLECPENKISRLRFSTYHSFHLGRVLLWGLFSVAEQLAYLGSLALAHFLLLR